MTLLPQKALGNRQIGITCCQHAHVRKFDTVDILILFQ